MIALLEQLKHISPQKLKFEIVRQIYEINQDPNLLKSFREGLSIDPRSKTVSELSEEFGIPARTLYRWACRLVDGDRIYILEDGTIESEKPTCQFAEIEYFGGYFVVAKKGQIFANQVIS